MHNNTKIEQNEAGTAATVPTSTETAPYQEQQPGRQLAATENLINQNIPCSGPSEHVQTPQEKLFAHVPCEKDGAFNQAHPHEQPRASSGVFEATLPREAEYTVQAPLAVLDDPPKSSLLIGKVPTPGLTAKTPDQILEMTFDPSETYLFDGVFSKGQVMTLLGPGGIGKSRILLQLAAAMIVGKDFLETKMPARKLNWLFIQNENSARRLQADFQRLKSWTGDEAWQEVSAHIRIQTPEKYEDALLDLEHPTSKKLVESYIEQNQPDVVVFDPLYAFTSRSLNSDTTMRRLCILLNQVSRLGNEKCSVIVVHHTVTGKEGARKAVGWDRASYGRGSKALHSWTRGQINIAPGSSTDNHRLMVSCGKNSNGQEFKPFGIRLNPDTLIYEPDKDFSLEEWEARLNGEADRLSPSSITTLVAKGPVSKKELVDIVMEKFGCKKSVAYEAISKATGDTIELNLDKKFDLKKSEPAGNSES